MSEEKSPPSPSSSPSPAAPSAPPAAPSAPPAAAPSRPAPGDRPPDRGPRSSEAPRREDRPDRGPRGERSDRGPRGGSDRGPRGERGGGGPRGRRRFRRGKVCRFCVNKVIYIDYKEVEQIRRYLTDRGKILPRRITGNCARHQRMVARAIKRARNIALIPFKAR